MKYLKTFEGLIDYLNKKEIDKKSEAGEELSISDITAGSDIYCGNHTNTDDEFEICGYYFGEMNPGAGSDFVKNITKRKCPDCGMQIGRRVMHVSTEDLETYEEDLPGEGFYLFSKEGDNESDSDSSKPIQKVDSQERVVKTSSHDISYYMDKYFNVLLAAYVAITPQKHQVNINEVSIRKALETLRRECKYKDNKRSKEAIEKFNMMMDPMMADAEKSIHTWTLGSNGKKYYETFKGFVDQLHSN
jgi:hypothetical protein